MKSVKQNLIFSILIAALFSIDRYSKNIILNLLQDQNNLYINDYLNLNLVFNTGIGFGLLSLESGFFYHLITFVIFLVIIVLCILFAKSNFNEKFFFSLIIGGAIGNLYDRIIFKAVPDFIDLHFQNFHWFSFNIADIFISLGIIFMLLNELIFKNKKNEN